MALDEPLTGPAFRRASLSGSRMSEAREPTPAWLVCEWVEDWIGWTSTDQGMFGFGIPSLRYDVAIAVVTDEEAKKRREGRAVEDVEAGRPIPAPCSKEDARRIITLALGLQPEKSDARRAPKAQTQLTIFGDEVVVKHRTTTPRYRPFSRGQLRAAAAQWLQLEDEEKLMRAARAVTWYEHDNPCIWRFRRDELIVSLAKLYVEIGETPGQNALAWAVSEAMYRKSSEEYTDDEGRARLLFRDPFSEERSLGVQKMTVYDRLVDAGVERRRHGERNFMAYSDRRKTNRFEGGFVRVVCRP